MFEKWIYCFFCEDFIQNTTLFLEMFSHVSYALVATISNHFNLLITINMETIECKTGKKEKWDIEMYMKNSSILESSGILAKRSALTF